MVVKIQKSTNFAVAFVVLLVGPTPVLASALTVDNVKYLELKKSWKHDDTVNRAFEAATSNIDTFVRQMSSYYGLPVYTSGKRTWHYDLQKAIDAANSRDWNAVIENCNSTFLVNPYAIDAVLLRAAANNEIQRSDACLIDLQIIYNVRAMKARSHMQTGFVHAGQNPVADHILVELSSGSIHMHRNDFENVPKK